MMMDSADIKMKNFLLRPNMIKRFGEKLLNDVLDKFDGKCSNCGSEENLIIHHEDGRGRNYEKKGLKPNNSFHNLRLLCSFCHKRYHRLKQPDPRIISVKQLDLNGKTINTYSSLENAMLATKVFASNIGHCLKGKRKTAGGFKWERN